MFSGILLSEMSQNLRGLNAPRDFGSDILLAWHISMYNFNLWSLLLPQKHRSYKLADFNNRNNSKGNSNRYREISGGERRKLKYVIESRYINNSYRQHERQYHCTY